MPFHGEGSIRSLKPRKERPYCPTRTSRNRRPVPKGRGDSDYRTNNWHSKSTEKPFFRRSAVWRRIFFVTIGKSDRSKTIVRKTGSYHRFTEDLFSRRLAPKARLTKCLPKLLLYVKRGIAVIIALLFAVIGIFTSFFQVLSRIKIVLVIQRRDKFILIGRFCPILANALSRSASVIFHSILKTSFTSQYDLSESYSMLHQTGDSVQ